MGRHPFLAQVRLRAQPAPAAAITPAVEDGDPTPAPDPDLPPTPTAIVVQLDPQQLQQLLAPSQALLDLRSCVAFALGAALMSWVLPRVITPR